MPTAACGRLRMEVKMSRWATGRLCKMETMTMRKATMEKMARPTRTMTGRKVNCLLRLRTTGRPCLQIPESHC